jgi:DNA-binding transcriptional regulator YiaG
VSPTELRAALERFGLSQAAFARLTGRHRATVQCWVHGDLTVPLYISLIVRLLDVMPTPVRVRFLQLSSDRSRE